MIDALCRYFSSINPLLQNIRSPVLNRTIRKYNNTQKVKNVFTITACFIRENS